jgi:SNF2 family DNA or RNA helicase
MSGKPVFAEISEDDKSIEIYFRFDHGLVNNMHEIRAVFVPKDKGGPFWKIPLDFDEARNFSAVVGQDYIELGDALRAWGWDQRNLEKMLYEIRTSEDWKLDALPEIAPQFNEWLRPDQRVGIAWMSIVPNPLNGDQMGLGKTATTIGTVLETRTFELGISLVICPVTSAAEVWQPHLEEHEPSGDIPDWTHQPFPVYTATGEAMSRSEREATIEKALAAEGPSWLIVNPDMVRLVKKDADTPEWAKVVSTTTVKDKATGETVTHQWVYQYEIFQSTVFGNVILDEFQKRGLRHPETPTARGIKNLELADGGKKFALSGSPQGGKTINLFGPLNWLEPKRYSSKWRFIDNYLEVEDNGFGKVVGNVREDREEDFNRHMDRIMLRRLKKDVLKNLPPKIVIDRWVDMTPKQKKQYVKFAKDAEIRLGNLELSATNVLDEYVRLKQFAGALRVPHEKKVGTLAALPDSGKLLRIVEDLEELGIVELDGNGKIVGEGESDEQVVIGSQFSSMVDMFEEFFEAHNIRTLKITGDVRKKGARSAAKREFQSGKGARIMLMTIQTGGVSIDLDRANTAMLVDEMWDPDDQEQFEDRIHRASRIHQVTILYYRSKKTVEEYIAKVTGGKKEVNDAVLNRKIKLYG